MARPATPLQKVLVAVLFGKPNAQKSAIPNQVWAREWHFPRTHYSSIPTFQL